MKGKAAFAKESYLPKLWEFFEEIQESRQGRFCVACIDIVKSIYPRGTAWVPGVLVFLSALLTAIILLHKSAASALHSA